MLDEQGDAHLIDFGEAQRADAPKKQQKLGTSSYRAPEARGDVYSQAIDIYSYGMVVRGLISRVRSQGDELTRLKELEAMCVQKDPAMRSSAAELVRFLSQASGSASGSAEPREVRLKSLSSADLRGSSTDPYEGLDSEEATNRARAGSMVPRCLQGTELHTELCEVDQDFTVYVSTHTYHHRLCTVVETWHKSGRAKFRKMSFEEVKRMQGRSGCERCKDHFPFVVIASTPRGTEARPSPAPNHGAEASSLGPVRDKVPLRRPAPYTRPRVRWTEAEEQALLEGVRRHGSRASWARIRDSVDGFQPCRTNVDLKDKYRNLMNLTKNKKSMSCPLLLCE